MITVNLIKVFAYIYIIYALGKKYYKRTNIKVILAITLTLGLSLLLYDKLHSSDFIYLASNIIIIFVCIKIYLEKDLLWSLCTGVLWYVYVEVLYTIAAIISFPILAIFKIDINSILAIVILCSIQFLLSIIAINYTLKRFSHFILEIAKSTQIGFLLVCLLIEAAFLEFKRLEYNSDEIALYRILLFVIFFGSIVLIIWIIDKNEERKKIQELTTYIHRTREVIPSVGRALEKIGKLSDNLENSKALIEELQSICQTDHIQTRKEVAAIKSFGTTGSVVLDEQLTGYLQEAVEYDFELDIMTLSPVTHILESKYIERYQLLQMIGDLYRNAFKVITKRTMGRILICFGFGRSGAYEISIYDNGQPFPKYVLDHLGKRGVTTGGTGHGMADIFTVLKASNASFVLNQALANHNTFTKGISIVFDQESRIEVIDK